MKFCFILLLIFKIGFSFCQHDFFGKELMLKNNVKEAVKYIYFQNSTDSFKLDSMLFGIYDFDKRGNLVEKIEDYNADMSKFIKTTYQYNNDDFLINEIVTDSYKDDKVQSEDDFINISEVVYPIQECRKFNQEGQLLQKTSVFYGDDIQTTIFDYLPCGLLNRRKSVEKDLLWKVFYKYY